MDQGDIFPLIVRWLHLVSAAAWVGGSLFYLIVLRPALRRSPEASRLISAAAASEFRALVDICILLLIVTGVIMTFNRLAAATVGSAYVAVLALKIVLSAWMFGLAWGRRRRAALPSPEAESSDGAGRLRRVFRALSGYNLLVILGIVVFLLADLLKTLYEMAISG